MKPINLRALQGAFIALALGSAAAAVVLLLERRSLAPLVHALHTWCRRCGRQWRHMRHVCAILAERATHAIWYK